ncbi:polysaccharide deacetylase family protein [Pinibacter soli]|uniref:Polysaccharide deacetylase family protein n=1 Tax=Pinibacter soli TaxID=3044211 RepID=A0ABT6RJ19_9BACT|nr:polysaccharide deacetylase family protein [Pinibacter soli]MDI3322565.1 polysaccharide deacetylase family protein [Pinibacter soli]
MNPSTTQVFQTNSATRWQRFKWTSRILLFLAVLGIVIITITLVRDYKPSIPQLKEKNDAYKKILQTNQAFFRDNKINKQYAGFRSFIDTKMDKNQQLGCYVNRYSQNPVDVDKLNPFTGAEGRPFYPFNCGIRAAFYVAWDPQSYFSLRRNISKLNLVIPEWMFIDPKGDSLYTNIDDRAYQLMKESKVKIMPILSNNFQGTFQGEAVHRIINDPKKKERLIKDILKVLSKGNFAGINVDLEDLVETKDEPIIAFQKELYARLHEKGYLVSQDVMPFNDDYNYTELAKCNDYIFLMAYDQFYDMSSPGPVSAQKWIEAAVDEAAKNIPSEKIILCLAGYGYDWPKDGQASNVTYQEALTTARESDGKIDFNNDTYNLHFSYFDDNDHPHEVYFTDAATNFNTLRFATEYGLSGVALWRLGSEDSRLWDFYDKDMGALALQHFDFGDFASVESSNDVDYIGDGEILDVLSTPTNGQITTELDSAQMLISEEHYVSLPSMFVVKKYGKVSPKQVLLTFDDGPDPIYTPQVLDILAQEHVPAAFFLLGINAENNIPLVKRIYNEGHEIGNHTFSHPNVATISKRRANIEFESTRLLIEAITGHSTILFRAPYNADAMPETMEELVPVALARQKNYLDVGESIDPEDWEPSVSADTIVQRIIDRKAELDTMGGIILLHDAGGDNRTQTVKALPRIIKYFKDNGYTFITLSELLRKKKDELMPPVPKGSGYTLMQFNYYMAEFGYWGGRILSSLFLVFIFLSLGRILLMAVLASRQNKKDKQLTIAPVIKDFPLVSIIVPAYNEEVNAVSSLSNLLKTDYPNFEVLFIDDGSKDSTYDKVNNFFADNPKVKVFTKPNGGKASALNYGILQSKAEYVVCIDADTKLLPDAISKLMQDFLTTLPGADQMGAVAGNVKVGNEVNMLTKWQSIEYITSQNFDRKAFAAVNAITVVPGAIGAFRKKAIEEAGGFTTDTLAEDCDLTIRILRCGYTVNNENKAIAMTEAPETLKMFLKQRFRWSFGVMQTFWKNRDALFNWKYKWLGWLALPNILVFQFMIPAIAPLADVFMIIGILTGNAAKILSYYFIFMLVDGAVSILAFSFEKEKYSKLWWLFPQRLIYRWLMYYILFKSFRKAIKGELQHWGVLKRTGNVKDIVLMEN